LSNVLTIITLAFFALSEDGENQYYYAQKQCGNDQFMGYASADRDLSYFDTLSHQLNPSAYIYGIPALRGTETIFKVFQGQSYDVFVKEDRQGYPQSHSGRGTLGAFDFLGSAVTYSAFAEAKAVPFEFVPALNFAAQDFLTKFINTEQDRPQLYPYIFTHANQINQYPELYIDCYLEAYEDFGSYIDGQLKSTFYQDLYVGEGDFYGFLRQSVVYWQNKGYSEYYDQDQFISSLTDFESKTTEEIIELFNGKISCLYQGMTVADRLVALRKLVLEGNMSGSVLGIFNKANAEQAAVKILSSTPANDAQALIDGLMEQSLFVQLAEGFRDGGMFWHDDNLTAFSQALFGLARLAYPPPGSDSEYNQFLVNAEEEDKIFRIGQDVPLQYTVYSNSVGLGSNSPKSTVSEPPMPSPGTRPFRPVHPPWWALRIRQG